MPLVFCVVFCCILLCCVLLQLGALPPPASASALSALALVAAELAARPRGNWYGYCIALALVLVHRAGISRTEGRSVNLKWNVWFREREGGSG